MKIFIIILLTISLWSLDMDDIETLRKNNAKVAFSNTKTLKSIPMEISTKEFRKATILDFNGMNLSDHLPDLREMRNLKILNLNSVNITLKELKKIDGLDLSILKLNNNPHLFDNGGQIIDPLGGFRLEELYLSNTGGSDSSYTAIGTTFPNLRILDLSDNSIKNLKKMYLKKLSSLEKLNLSGNSLSYFNTTHLPTLTLKYLNLANTKFSKFNYTKDFPSLVSLNLSGNDSIEMDVKYKGAMVLQKLQNIAPTDLMSKKNNTSTLSSNQSTLVSKWIIPNKSICRENGGKISKKNGCEANLKNAIKICNVSGGSLPSRNDFHKIIIDCGGIADANSRKKWNKNARNSNYRKCYENKNFFSSGWYWTSEDYDFRRTWNIGFNRGSDSYNLKSNYYYVQCVK